MNNVSTVKVLDSQKDVVKDSLHVDFFKIYLLLAQLLEV